MNFRVLKISTNVDEYPYCKEDSEEFPDLMEYVEDEMETFIYCLEDDCWWIAHEFFSMVRIKSFSSDNVNIK